MGRAFIAQKTGWSYDVIDILPYPEFRNQIKFFADPESFQKERSKDKDVLKEKLESIKKRKRRTEERFAKKG